MSFDSDISIFSSDKKSKINNGFNGIVRDLKWDIVLSKFDIINPKFSLLREGRSGDYTKIWLVTFTRKNIVSWEVVEYIQIETNYNLDKSKSIAQKYDLSKENPDPANITVFAPLQPSSSSETVVYPQGVTVPNQGGFETK